MEKVWEQGSNVPEEQAKKIISGVEEYWIPFKESAWIISSYAQDRSYEVLENRYELWWNPTEENKKWIEGIRKDKSELFEKIEWKIKFEWELVIINWMKFDNKPLDFLWNYEKAKKKVEEVDWRRLPEVHEFEALFSLFNLDRLYHSDELIKFLKLSNHSYWSSTEDNNILNIKASYFLILALYANPKTSNDNRVICIHD